MDLLQSVPDKKQLRREGRREGGKGAYSSKRVANCREGNSRHGAAGSMASTVGKHC